MNWFLYDNGLRPERVKMFRVVFNILYILSFVWTTFFMEPQPLFVFLQSEAGSNINGDKAKSCKHQSHDGA